MGKRRVEIKREYILVPQRGPSGVTGISKVELDEGPSSSSGLPQSFPKPAEVIDIASLPKSKGGGLLGWTFVTLAAVVLTLILVEKMSDSPSTTESSSAAPVDQAQEITLPPAPSCGRMKVDSWLPKVWPFTPDGDEQSDPSYPLVKAGSVVHVLDADKSGSWYPASLWVQFHKGTIVPGPHASRPPFEGYVHVNAVEIVQSNNC